MLCAFASLKKKKKKSNSCLSLPQAPCRSTSSFRKNKGP
uniref:Macaca fascicularis brain cDNA clone: QflA-21555, similar to human O-acyltransferase (membrane bound) domain containing 1(OACT1), mRNA, RefSeq: XM_371801.2 n=1 Tax=Macaca fascicularis TaxID=9541 RepID=I7G705_MACFA|nr:unnamed protein product [Macaca fascicularis]